MYVFRERLLIFVCVSIHKEFVKESDTVLNDHLFGKELFIWFTVYVFRERLLIVVCVSIHKVFVKESEYVRQIISHTDTDMFPNPQGF